MNQCEVREAPRKRARACRWEATGQWDLKWGQAVRAEMGGSPCLLVSSSSKRKRFYLCEKRSMVL
jgi:hypothetical protein